MLSFYVIILCYHFWMLLIVLWICVIIFGCYHYFYHLCYHFELSFFVIISPLFYFCWKHDTLCSHPYLPHLTTSSHLLVETLPMYTLPHFWLTLHSFTLSHSGHSSFSAPPSSTGRVSSTASSFQCCDSSSIWSLGMLFKRKYDL